MSSLLNITQLGWEINKKQILQNISFDVCKGEVIGIIGPNGAGKTSLLHCLTNQLPNISNSFCTGSVFFKNKQITHYSAKSIAKSFALVMQNNAPIFALSVLDVMKMGLLPHKSIFAFNTDYDHHQIELALDKVGLKDSVNDAFNQLSGGEQQRVLIARALVQSTEILILDEPTNHLDVFYQHQVLHLVNKLNVTVIMTVHDLNLASQYCQRLLLLNKGKLIADGTPSNVLTNEILSNVFRLPCQQDIDPITNSTRVSFYLKGLNSTREHRQIL